MPRFPGSKNGVSLKSKGDGPGGQGVSNRLVHKIKISVTDDRTLESSFISGLIPP